MKHKFFTCTSCCSCESEQAKAFKTESKFSLGRCEVYEEFVLVDETMRHIFIGTEAGSFKVSKLWDCLPTKMKAKQPFK